MSFRHIHHRGTWGRFPVAIGRQADEISLEGVDRAAELCAFTGDQLEGSPTGDEAFDDAVWASETSEGLPALASAEGRALLSWLVGQGGRVADGRVSLPFLRGADLPRDLKGRLVHLACLLQRRDPPEVALRACFELEDEPELEVELAGRLAEGAEDALDGLLGLSALSDAAGERAVALLEERGAAERVVARTEDLAGRGPRTRLALLALLRTRGVAGEVGLLTLLAQSDEAAALAARALGETVTGAAAVVPVLVGVSEDPARPTALREAARAAVVAIQARLGPEAGGRLALADGGGLAGAVSVAAARAGALALARRDGEG